MKRRVTQRTTLAAAVLLAAPAFGQTTPDVLVKYFDDQDESVGGTPGIGGFAYNPANGQFWTLGFVNLGQAIRRIDPSATTDYTSLSLNTTTNKWALGPSLSSAYVAAPNGYGASAPLAWGIQESDWNKFSRSSSLANGTTNTNLSGQPTVGNMRLNPSPLTIAGVTYGVGQLGILTDAMNVNSNLDQSLSKVVYAYDLRNVGAPQPVGGRERDTNPADDGLASENKTSTTRIDWNDVFDIVATKKDFIDASNGAVGTFNMGRNFAYSAENGRYIYMNDTQPTYGGIWRVDLQSTGSSGLKRIIPVGVAPLLNIEPAVVHTGVRDLDPQDASTGDQIVYESSSATAPNVAAGGFVYRVHNPNTEVLSAERTLVHPTRMQSVLGLSPDLDGIASNGAAGFFFYDGSSIMRMDAAGRISSVASSEQRSVFGLANNAEDAVGQGSVLDLQVRTMNVTRGATTFSVPEVLYSDGLFDAPIGALAFKTGDLNADNVVNAADTAVFIGEFNRDVAAGLPRSNANYANYLKADLNGNVRTVTLTGGAGTGITVDAVDEKDLLLLFQHINKLPGDANLDGVVNGDDQTILNNNIGTAGNWLKGDFNRDGTVNAADQALLTANLNATYSLEGFDPVANYTGGANGTWEANVRKADAVTGADADSFVTLARVGGATVSGPAANAGVAYLTVGNNGPDARTTLNLAAGVTVSSTEGVLVRSAGGIAGPAGATLRVGIPGYPAALAIDEGGTLSGAFRIEGGLYVTSNSNIVFDGIVANNGASLGTLSKFGAGVMTLSAVQTYTGATIVGGGTLQVNGSIAASATPVSVRSTGTLAGTGTIAAPVTIAGGTVNGTLTINGAVIVQSGGTLAGTPKVNALVTMQSGGIIAPGNSPGEIDLNAGLTLVGGAILNFDLGTGGSDLIDLNGGTFAGNTSGKVIVNLTSTGGLANGQVYTLIDFTGATATSVDASDFVVGSGPIAGVFSVQNNAVILTIPEPSTAGLALASGAIGLLARRRRGKGAAR